MARRSSLREFQERLARRLAEARTADRRGLLGFQAGSENWLIDLAEAGEILPLPPLAPVPLTQPWYRGVANVRGTLYGIVDLACFHGQAPTPVGGRSRLLLAGTRLGIHCALLVTASAGLRSADDFETDLEGDARPWVGKRLRDAQGHAWLQLDAARLLTAPRFLDASVE
ncbi:chemotaxis protein CheW [Thauera sp.]|uniref:chemotaxis protein CheW n=1 Tax=Thauera sp. TaxID=1905334 RepID=UPI0039E3885B